MSDQPAVTVETLKELYAAFNRHNVDAIMAFFAEDCIMDLPRGSSPGGKRYTGKASVREGIEGRFAGLPDAHYGDERHWTCGDRGTSEWLLTGTTAAGQRLEVRGCDLWEFQNGKIVRKDSFWKIIE